jgi:two-component system, NarL family, response regulator LiaR
MTVRAENRPYDKGKPVARRGRKARGLPREAAQPPKGETSVRLLLVDDNAPARAGLRSAIEFKTTFEVVGEAQDGREAVRLVRELQPDLVLMDVRMPVMDGVEATTIIKQERPETYVLAMSGSADPTTVAGMLRAGASGYILKGDLPETFLSPLEAAQSGHRLQPIEPLTV